MKKTISTLLSLTAICFSVAAQTTPPMRGDISSRELEPFVMDLWNGTGNGEGSARKMLDDFDSRAQVREGLVRSNLKGESVYWEPYYIFSGLMAHRADSTEVQDSYYEGSSRQTGRSYKARTWTDSKHFTETTEFAPEGFFAIFGCTLSYQDSHKTATKKKESSKMGAGDLQIAYTPLQVHLKSAEVVAPVYEGYTGAMEIQLADVQDRWCIDGYTLKVTSMNTDIFTVEAPEITTGADGKAKIRLHGVKKGKGRIRFYLYIAQPENNCYVQVEEYYDVEVLEAEKWHYSLSVHDQFTLPARDYILSGNFTVISTLGEDDIPLNKVLEVSPATRSGVGSFHAMAEFLTETQREDGIVMGFDIAGIHNRAQGAVGAAFGMIGESIEWGRTGHARTEKSDKVITAMLMLLEEGSWPYKVTLTTLDKMSGGAVMGADADISELMKEEEAKAKAKEEKPKKTSTFKQIRQGMKAMKDLKNLKIEPMPETPVQREAYTEQQAVSKALQIAYIKEHHCLIFPDLTLLLNPHWGNELLEVKKSGPGIDISWMYVSGTLTMRKEKQP